MADGAIHNGAHRGTTNGVSVLDKVRTALADADATGQPRPGRPALSTLIGASEYQVRRALEALAVAGDQLAPAAEEPVDGSPALAPGPAAYGDQLASAGGHQPPPARRAGDATGAADSPPELAVASTGDAAAAAGAPAPGARLVAWLGFVFGSLMSIAANVLHTWLPAAHQPSGWSPGLAPQIGAAVWPIALLLSVEALSRVAWPRTFWWSLARYGGAGLVATGAAVISYSHVKAVLLAWGYGHPGADVGPLVLDGLMVVCGFALLAISERR